MRANNVMLLLERCLEAGSGDNELPALFLVGPPGVGKTSMAYQVAQEQGVGFRHSQLTINEPSDLKGLPFPDGEGHTLRWLHDGYLPLTVNGARPDMPERGIWLLDDLTTAPPLVQASAYQAVIWPHQVGTAKLLPGWIVMGAGNRETDQALVKKMPTPLANRFTHIHMDWELEHMAANLVDWSDWAAQAGVHPVIISFLNSPAATQSDHHLLFHFNPKLGQNAFPTPRSWEKVSRWKKAALPRGIEQEAIEGTVGKGAATALWAFEALFSQLPDPMEILERGNFAVTPTRRDLQYALTCSLAQVASTAKHYENAIQWAEKVSPELGVLLLKIISGRDMPGLYLAPSYVKWARANLDVVMA
jgi:DNA polymerase III delta prime subunit